jgi:myo-inositol 2-dehydrogenase/D-chiro-inositol 1-dehydrogenase
MAAPLNVALFGAGLIGSFHAETLGRLLPDVRLVAIADPVEAAARRVIADLKLEQTRYDRQFEQTLADSAVEAVVIATPGATHPELIAAAARAGKPIFCEKPLGHALEPARQALTEVERAGVPLQIGFQRRFDPGFQRARRLVEDGTLGQVQLLRSITRDPAKPRPEAALPWAVFRETLIHDFDVLRWLAGSEAVELYARAEAFWATNRGEAGAYDTAMVQIRFANGALATADASFHAVYGYDVRAEVYGANGMVTVGDGRLDSAVIATEAGVGRPQAHWFQDLFGQAYRAELADFVRCVREGRQPAVSGQDGLQSLRMALAAIESVETGRPVSVEA